MPHSPLFAASIAWRPKRVASTRSNAVGVPPRWTWPRTVARVSLPVRFSISPSSQWAIPPSRTWPKASSLSSIGLGHAADGHRALGDDDDRGEPSLEAASDQLADLLEVEGLLRDQDDVGAAGEPGVEGDPAGVTAHHLDDQDPVVAVGRRVEAVDRLHRDVDRGVEAEGVVGRAEVVVDRLRDADDRDALLGVKSRGGPQGVLPADRDQALDAVALEVLDEALGIALLLERVGAGGAEDRPPARQDPAHLGHPERSAVAVAAGRASRRGSRRTRDPGIRPPCGRSPGSRHSGRGSRHRL